MKILDLHMTTVRGPDVRWLDEQGNLYRVPLARADDGSPVRPFEVLRPKSVVHNVSNGRAKRYFYMHPRGEGQRSRFDSDGRAHATTVAEALRRAEKEGLYEKLRVSRK